MPVYVDGARELRSSLKRAGADLTQLKGANRAAANVVSPVATAMAPHRTGLLAATVRTGATQRAGVIRAGRKSVPYAGPIHWGWPRKHIRPHTFLTDAARRTEPAWMNVFKHHVDDVIDSVKGA